MKHLDQVNRDNKERAKLELVLQGIETAIKNNVDPHEKAELGHVSVDAISFDAINAILEKHGVRKLRG